MRFISAQGPLLRALHVGGQREPRAEHVGHVALVVHDLRALEALVADPGDHDPVHRFGVAGEAGGEEEEQGDGGGLESERHGVSSSGGREGRKLNAAP